MLSNILLVQHATRQGTVEVADLVRTTCEEFQVNVICPDTPMASERNSVPHLSPDNNGGSWENVDLVIALGGDGTLLTAAEYARELDVPVIGINTGHMGFLTEVGVGDIRDAVRRLIKEEFSRDLRATIDVEVQHASGLVERGWALNEAAVIRTELDRPADFSVGIDGRGVSGYAADGIIISTPTGSTAYSYSAGGPIVWPNVEAMLMVPLAAHGLFRTPLVVGSSSTLEIKIDRDQWCSLEIWFDGKRKMVIQPGARITAHLSSRPITLAALSAAPFTARLVSKFKLPVDSWRMGYAQ